MGENWSHGPGCWIYCQGLHLGLSDHRSKFKVGSFAWGKKKVNSVGSALILINQMVFIR